MLGIIGGTSLLNLEEFKKIEEVKISTPFGSPSDTITIVEYQGKKLAFLPRHGKNHSIPPHMVNYRANIWALKELGVKCILGITAVGSLKEEIKPKDFVFPDQFIDKTHGRKNTFFEGGKNYHISMGEPLCVDLRKTLIETAEEVGISSHKAGTLVCINGPRFSSRAESKMYCMLGGDIINMTMLPEAALAREAEMCYASIATVTDYDSWKDSIVEAGDIWKVVKENEDNLKKFLLAIIPKISVKECSCHSALENACL